MGMNRMKAAADWFHSVVFQEEAIRPGPARKARSLPVMLRTARSLENGPHQNWQSRESVFLKQGRLLAGYEDDYEEGPANVQRYYPTYQSLSDEELRGYFSWRTKFRRGEVRRTSLSFAFLYIYELINQIGVEDPLDGYRRLLAFRDAYGEADGRVLPYLEQWRVDYVVYYGLDPELLADSAQVLLDRSIEVLEQADGREPEEIAAAAKRLAPKWLGRSRFYAAHQEEMDLVTARVLRRMRAHFAARCKKTLTEQYFGGTGVYQVRPFQAAVFCDPLKRRNYEYAVDGQYSYRCEKGVWSVRKRAYTPETGAKLEALLKTIDAEMRLAWEDRHPVQASLDTKWILRIIRKEIQALLTERQAAEAKKVAIDYSQLTRIRQDAAVTREKLIVDEEAEEPDPLPPPPAPQPEEPDGQEGPSLSPPERRLLQCLLYGGDLGWIQTEGRLLSVLVDAVNEKLYDVFGDTVLDGGPQVIEDYIDDLKEMVRP